MIADDDCVAYKTMFWQCSTKNYVNEVLFQGNFANNTTWSCGICVSSRGEIIGLNLNHDFLFGKKYKKVLLSCQTSC